MEFSRRTKLLISLICIVFCTTIGCTLLYIERHSENPQITGTLQEDPRAVPDSFETAEPESADSSPSPLPDHQINLNTASMEELSTLEGIGPSLAERIISYREKKPFKTIYDLKKVAGIGDKRFREIENLICVGD